jgi:hypothetical protein
MRNSSPSIGAAGLQNLGSSRDAAARASDYNPFAAGFLNKSRIAVPSSLLRKLA